MTGKNEKCMVRRTLPAVDNVPERTVVCGHLMKYVRAAPARNIKSGGTKGLWDQFKSCHPKEYKVEMNMGSHSIAGKTRGDENVGSGLRRQQHRR